MNNTRTQEKLRQWMFGVSLGLWVFGAVGAMAAPVPATLPRPDGKPADMTKKVKVYKPLQVVLAVAAMVVVAMSAPAQSGDPTTTLWYSRPARSWQHEALPIGNGRMGAMIFGGVGHERIALNEDTVWSGSRVNWNRQGAGEW